MTMSVYRGKEIHRIYTVIDATNQANPLVAGNQGSGAHHRPVAEGVMCGISNPPSATNYFLRAS